MVEWSVSVACGDQGRARRVYDLSAAFRVKRTCGREVSMKLELSERAAEQLRRLVGETGGRRARSWSVRLRCMRERSVARRSSARSIVRRGSALIVTRRSTRQALRR